MPLANVAHRCDTTCDVRRCVRGVCFGGRQLKEQPPHRAFARHYHGSVVADERLAQQKAEMLPLVNDLCRQLRCTKLSTVVVMCAPRSLASRPATASPAARQLSCLLARGHAGTATPGGSPHSSESAT